MIRPQPARWFEILAARDDTARCLEALARTGAIELESRPDVTGQLELGDVQPLLQEFAALSRRHHAYWPQTGCKPSAETRSPASLLTDCLACIRAWARDAEPLIREFQHHDAQRTELELWRGIFAHFGVTTLDFSQLASSGPLLASRLFVFPAASMPPFPTSALIRRVEVQGLVHALVIAPVAGQHEIAQQVAALKGQVFEVPSWLKSDLALNAAYIDERLALVAQEMARLHAGLEALHARHELYRTLGDARRLQWLTQNAGALKSGEHFVWITGWTSDTSGARISDAIEHSGTRALAHFPQPPAGARAPLTLANPWWARPFEIFSRALGMPSENEPDPSRLLAIVVPLLFGYMFGDVGQGFALALAGWLMRNRLAVARLLIAGGLSAAVFGVLFGSVFSIPRALPALWLDPLDDPMTILAVPLLAGALLLTIGLAFGALEARWRGELASWLHGDGGLVGVYIGILTGYLHPLGFAFAVLSGLVYCIGHGWLARRPATALAALGELMEKTLQLLINTLSFARVGAFALAHAGLSSAIVALMAASDSVIGKALVLVIGNGVVLVLEAMVVSIQTTRLVLFEFFTRFLTGEGRAFRPLPPPSFQES
jgi:V/A-type H+-transporting ATPase subunit I